MLEGFNCTIFAYGQTGTGKTHTMQGDCSGELSEAAGVIPRAVAHIFASLEAANSEYSVKCTFLELYNEEITDLLSAEEEDPRRLPAQSELRSKPLALMEDGKGGVMVKGLEEVIVMNATEIFSVLERGTSKRRTAETLLNKQSSRSHSIFALTIHIKEMTAEGEELIKVGKLNLVDLAGSENISRSGATDKRAREAGEINKSLLTLGRVINNLVEHQQHIPYRDSKLTRLLRDALGGHSKTCIIATVAPGSKCLDETLSTLDYAHRAKNIRNKPEVNAKTTKTALIKDMVHEIDRLKADLVATREKNGVYMAPERYAEYESERREAKDRAEALTSEIALREAELAELRALFETRSAALEALTEAHGCCVADLGATRSALLGSESSLRLREAEVRESAHLLQATAKAEAQLAALGGNLARQLRGSAADVSNLFAKVERKDSLEQRNGAALRDLRAAVEERLGEMQAACACQAREQRAAAQQQSQALAALHARRDADAHALAVRVDAMQSAAAAAAAAAREAAAAAAAAAQAAAAQAGGAAGEHAAAVAAAASRAAAAMEAAVEALSGALSLGQAQAAALGEHLSAAAEQADASLAGLAAAAEDALEGARAAAAAGAEGAGARAQAADAALAAAERRHAATAQREQEALLSGVAALLSAFSERSAAGLAGALAEARAEVAAAAGDVARAADAVALQAVQGQQGVLCARGAAAEAVADAAREGLTRLGALAESLDGAALAATAAGEEAACGRGAATSLCLAFAQQAGRAHASAARDSERRSDALAALLAALEREVQAGAQALHEALEDASGAQAAALGGLAAAADHSAAAAAAFADARLPAAGDAVRRALGDAAARFAADVPTGQTPLKTACAALAPDLPGSPAIAALRTRDLDALLAEFRGEGVAEVSEEAEEGGQEENVAPSEVAEEQPVAPVVAAQPAPASRSRIPRAAGLARSRSAPKAEASAGAEEAARHALAEVNSSAQ